MRKSVLVLILLGYSLLLNKAQAQCTIKAHPVVTNVNCTGTLGTIDLAPTGAKGDSVYYFSIVGNETQWASTVIGFSSEYSSPPNSWSSVKILGPPDVYPSYGDIGNAYLASNYGIRNFMIVGFANPMKVSEVDIYETDNPGTIDTIYVRNASTGVWSIVWQGTAHTGPAVATILKATFPQTAYYVDAVRFANNGAVTSGYEEYDAVSIIGTGQLHLGTTITGLGAGTYKYAVIDSAGCVDSTALLTIGVDPGIKILGVTTTNPSCTGNTNGSATFAIADAIGSYKYTIVDTTLWADTVLAFSSEYDSPPNGYSSIQILGKPDVYPTYDDNGNAFLAKNEGNREFIQVGYKRALSNVEEVDIYETYAPGTIDTVYVRNATTGVWNKVWQGTAFAGPAVATIFRAKFPKLAYPVNGVRFAYDGAANYDYNEFDAVSIVNKKAVSGTNVLNNLAGGSYNITFKDSAGCSVDATVNITDPDPLDVDYSYVDNSPLRCANDSMVFHVGGYGGTGTITTNWYGLNPNHVTDSLYHKFTFTDTKGCTFTDSIRGDGYRPATQLAVVANTTPSACLGSTGAVTFNVTGGVPPYQSPGTLTGLSAGSYYYVITDTLDCTVTGKAIISDANGPQVLPHVTDVKCKGDNTGKVTFTITGGTSPYSINTLGDDTLALYANNYNVLVTDSNGCKGAASYSVKEPDYLNINITTTDVKCFGDSNGTAKFVGLGGTPGYTFSFDPGVNPNALAAGNSYNVTMTDANQCSDNFSFDIYQAPKLVITSNVFPASCYGKSDGVLGVAVTGGLLPYTYNFGTIVNPSAVAGGTYTVTITDAAGCVVKDTATIAQPSAIVITPTVVSPTTKNGTNGSITLVVSGGKGAPYSFKWSNTDTTKNLSGLTAGTYIVTVKDAGGCDNVKSVVVPDLFLGINDPAQGLNIRLFPNPSNGLVTLQSDNELDAVTVYDAIGSLVYQTKTNQKTLVMDLTNQSAGIYFVKVSNRLIKFIKE